MRKKHPAAAEVLAFFLALFGSTVSSTTLSRAAASPDTSACDVANVSGAGDLHELLSRRAVEVVNLAGSSSWSSNASLSKLVAPTAQFNVGAGDVGRPLGVGVQGARALVMLLQADRFRFLNWDYMNFPVNACDVYKVTIEFINSESNQVAPIEFEFSSGRVTAARGQQNSFSTGALTPVSK